MAPATLMTLLPLAVRVGTTNADPTDEQQISQLYGAPAMVNQPLPYDVLQAYLNLTVVPGADTVLLKLQEFEIVSQSWFDVAGAATLAQVATGLIKMIIGPGITPIAAAVNIVAVNMFLPPIWRLVVVHSAGTNFTYSLSAGLEVIA